MEMILFPMKILLKVENIYLFIYFYYFVIEESQPDLTKSVLFHGVTYLGSATAATPRSEEELHRYKYK
jgi:hypothetical protein